MNITSITRKTRQRGIRAGLPVTDIAIGVGPEMTAGEIKHEVNSLPDKHVFIHTVNEKKDTVRLRDIHNLVKYIGGKPRVLELETNGSKFEGKLSKWVNLFNINASYSNKDTLAHYIGLIPRQTQLSFCLSNPQALESVELFLRGKHTVLSNNVPITIEASQELYDHILTVCPPWMNKFNVRLFLLPKVGECMDYEPSNPTKNIAPPKSTSPDVSGYSKGKALPTGTSKKKPEHYDEKKHPYKWFVDGDQLSIVKKDFVNLQESPAIFIPLSSQVALQLQVKGFYALPKAEQDAINKEFADQEKKQKEIKKTLEVKK